MQQLLNEIREQPDVLRRLVEEQYAAIRKTARAIRARNIRHVLIAARGTSDHVATYGKYLFGAMHRLPVALAAPSLYTVYGTPPSLEQTLVIGISQSGKSPDIVAVLEDARRQKAPTLAITNTPGSELAAMAEYVLDCSAGEERSVAATKTYTAEMMTLALLCVALKDDGDDDLHAMRQVPQAVQQTLDLNDDIGQMAQRYRAATNCVTLGRGYNYATALEIALKLKELNYLGASPYSTADFMHGPIAVVEEGLPAIVVAPSGLVFAEMLALIGELGARGADLMVISDQQVALERARTPMALAPQIPEWLSPLMAVVPGQLLATHLAVAKGLDPSRPRGLRKVTETR
ncbi:MAG: SIS domain-containing protein [Anaerolineae bacterium]